MIRRKEALFAEVEAVAALERDVFKSESMSLKEKLDESEGDGPQTMDEIRQTRRLAQQTMDTNEQGKNSTSTGSASNNPTGTTTRKRARRALENSISALITHSANLSLLVRMMASASKNSLSEERTARTPIMLSLIHI